jgi:hypothetical protein
MLERPEEPRKKKREISKCGFIGAFVYKQTDYRSHKTTQSIIYHKDHHEYYHRRP